MAEVVLQLVPAPGQILTRLVGREAKIERIYEVQGAPDVVEDRPGARAAVIRPVRVAVILAHDELPRARVFGPMVVGDRETVALTEVHSWPVRSSYPDWLKHLVEQAAAAERT